MGRKGHGDLLVKVGGHIPVGKRNLPVGGTRQHRHRKGARPRWSMRSGLAGRTEEDSAAVGDPDCWHGADKVSYAWGEHRGV
ncbi:hypothetical protein XMIN_2586 [Xanthomonas citri pv. mangiferaeindicae LMG 941]|nr:hypothetical protein XMIN_2586 [Xanthomonas citri pv. mangiferaeindicae LMG 941]